MDRDLNRALADAMSALPEEASYAATSLDSPPAPPRVERWITSRPRQARHARIGIDYSSQHLALAELARTRKGWDVQALRAEEFVAPLDARALAAILREFQPEHAMRVHLSITSSRAVVRQFSIPPVPKRRRMAAAIWEAQKLIPFPLREQDAVFGFSFSRADRKGWNVTLAAVPREDAAPILEALQSVLWTLEGVSVSGTQVLGCAMPGTNTATTDAVVAQVCWSRHRTSFAVHHENRVVFHYDIGHIAGAETLPGHSPGPEQIRAWLNALEKGIGEAIEFFLGSNARLSLSRIEVCGLAESTAPLVTNWSDRFEIPVVIHGPSKYLGCGLTAESEKWIEQHDGQFTMALLSAIGTPSVDLTPVSQLRRRNQQLHERLAISAGALSLALMITVSGYTYVHNRLAESNLASTETRLSTMQGSPANSGLESNIQKLASISQLSGVLNERNPGWSGLIKGLLHTFPDEARLMTLSISPTIQGMRLGSMPSIRMEGRLLPSGSSHEILFAEWVHDMESICGANAVTITSVRELEWKGRRSTLFVIEITPPIPPAEGS